MSDKETREAMYEFHGIIDKKTLRLPVHGQQVISRKRLSILRKEISADVSLCNSTSNKNSHLFIKEDIKQTLGCISSTNSSVIKKRFNKIDEKENLNVNMSVNIKGYKGKFKLPKISNIIEFIIML